MDLFIYLPGEYEVSRDEIEELIEAELGDWGEVTGGGSGGFGQTIDIEIFDDEIASDVMSEIRRALIDFGVPAETELVLDGESSLLIPGPQAI